MKTKFIFVFILSIVIFSLIPSFLSAADIRMASPNKGIDTSKLLVISGDIEKGDTETLTNLIFNLSEDQLPISTLLLGPSNGGNLEEAMSIGFLARTLKWKVIVLNKCYSACSMIALSSVYRVFAGEIGLHRPYYNPEFYEETDPFYVEQWHRRMDKEVRDFLEDAYVSESIIEKMMGVSSREMWTISATDADRVLSNFPSYFEELIFARCTGKAVTIPEFGMNADCLNRELSQMQRQSLITFLEAISQGEF
ncbi:hypothetical protein ATG98_3991 [Marinobacter sp. LV10R520-4]|uniref:hypothetical protein n=1 Tax=Marinobacter sp. LV10R520-4 TaxID=1761796 RepID=UPI000BF2FCD0|nr:hypothetical protein [Marinobacter sp. LV10R520-4]PFG54697.1 hypothetical protein ATG98_3991 [Marinobacter sp. LV10R520-4]